MNNLTNIDINELEFNVSEIFYSIQGEGTRLGRPCVFVRLQGCELRCVWCDTPYALEINQVEKIMTGRDIFNEVKKYDCNFVLFTGGEPLFQKNLIPLLDFFIKSGFETSIETNGHQSVKDVNPEVIKILDIKAPGSGMVKFNYFDNFQYLTNRDEIKCVITGREDYEWAKNIILEQKLHEKVFSVILSPATGLLELRELAEWILEDRLPVRLQVQLHKLIWSPDTRGV